MESLYGPDAVEREINRLSGQTMFGTTRSAITPSPKPITCAEPNCGVGWGFEPSIGRAYAFMEAMGAGWTHAGIGARYREWCPEHRPDGLTL